MTSEQKQHSELVVEVLTFFECPYADAVDPGLHSGCRWCSEAEGPLNALRSLEEQVETLQRERDQRWPDDWVQARANELVAQQFEIKALKEQLEAAQDALREIASYDGFGHQGVEAARIARRALSNPATERLIELTADPDSLDWKALENGEAWTGPAPATEPHECPYCDGRGWNTIAVHDPTDPDGEPLPEQEQCATCGGSGEVSRPASEPCAYCAGKGGRYRTVASRFVGTEMQAHQGPWESCSFCGGTGKASNQESRSE